MSIGEAITRARRCPCEKCEAWAKELENISRNGQEESKTPRKKGSKEIYDNMQIMRERTWDGNRE